MIYVILAGIGILSTWHILSHREHRAPRAAMLAAACALVILADWICYGILNLYAYTPGLLANPLQDGALGEVLADITFVPSLQLALAVYVPGVVGVASGTILVSLLEAGFVRFGLFEHRGWQVWMTAAAFPVYFGVLWGFYQAALRRGVTFGWISLVTRLSLVFSSVGVLTLLLRAQQWVHSNLHVLPTAMGNQSLGRFITYAVITVPLGAWVCAAPRPHMWGRLALVTLALVGENWLMAVVNFQQYRPPWGGAYDGLAQGAAILVAFLLQEWVQQQERMGETRHAV